VDIDATFAPVAATLIDSVFPTEIVYREQGPARFDPTTRAMTKPSVDHRISAGIVSRSLVEEGGSQQIYELALWVHFGAGGLPVMAKSDDVVLYDGLEWKVTKIDPAYSSKRMIAAKLFARTS
jgi:hypothetical protein